MNNQWKNEREGYKWSEKNAPDEKPDEKQKLHESKAGGSGQRRLESWSIINLLVTTED